jgi:hypothetical protein
MKANFGMLGRRRGEASGRAARWRSTALVTADHVSREICLCAAGCLTVGIAVTVRAPAVPARTPVPRCWGTESYDANCFCLQNMQVMPVMPMFLPVLG